MSKDGKIPLTHEQMDWATLAVKASSEVSYHVSRALYCHTQGTHGAAFSHLLSANVKAEDAVNHLATVLSED